MNIINLEEIIDKALEDPLVDAIITSVFSTRDWWAASSAINQEEAPFGSQLFESYRYVSSDLARISQYCMESLQWLIDDGIINSIKVDFARKGDFHLMRVAYDKNTLEVSIDV